MSMFPCNISLQRSEPILCSPYIHVIFFLYSAVPFYLWLSLLLFHCTMIVAYHQPRPQAHFQHFNVSHSTLKNWGRAWKQGYMPSFSQTLSHTYIHECGIYMEVAYYIFGAMTVLCLARFKGGGWAVDVLLQNFWIFCAACLSSHTFFCHVLFSNSKCDKIPQHLHVHIHRSRHIYAMYNYELYTCTQRE